MRLMQNHTSVSCTEQILTIIRCVTAARELVSQYIAAHGVEQKPGIAALLEFCKQAGLAYAVATATSQELARERLALARTGRDVPGHRRR